MKGKESRTTLNEKKVVVIGGSSGIGLAVAIAAAEEGAHVTIVSSNQHRLNDALKQLPQGAKANAVDLKEEAQIAAFFAQAGSIDHLVFTAGENLQTGNIGDVQLAEAHAFFETRYWGAVTAVKYAVPHINKEGSIVLTSGTTTQRPMAGWSIASSVCAAVEGLARALAVELAPLRVNLVCPGIVKTNLWNNFPEAEREGLYKTMANALLVKHVGEAEEIAQTYLYLMKQTYSTGQRVTVDGGGVLV